MLPNDSWESYLTSNQTYLGYWNLFPKKKNSKKIQWTLQVLTPKKTNDTSASTLCNLKDNNAYIFQELNVDDLTICY